MKLKQKTQMNVYVVNELRSDLKNIRYEIVLMMDKAGYENINSVGEMYHHHECGSLGTREVSLGCSSPKSV